MEDQTQEIEVSDYFLILDTEQLIKGPDTGKWKFSLKWTLIVLYLIINLV